MATPQAGWYPDPSGNESKLRYWDGTNWTDNFLDRTPAASDVTVTGTVTTSPTTNGTEGASVIDVTTVTTAPQGETASCTQTFVQESGAGAQSAQDVASATQTTQSTQTTAQYTSQPYTVPNPATPDHQSAQQFQNTQPTQNGYGQPNAVPYDPYQDPSHPVMYYVEEQDRILRLIAFIFMLISTITVGWAIFPLAWCIPMTVMCWRDYKGQRPNTTAFAVCVLLFVNLVAGILLLISKKDK